VSFNHKFNNKLIFVILNNVSNIYFLKKHCIMGRIEKPYIGKFSGNYKDVIIRIRNGKMVFYNKPKSRKDNKTEKVLNNRGVFTYTVKFASIVNGIYIFKKIWYSQKEKLLTAYSKIYTYNLKETHPEHLTIKNTMTPLGYYLILDSFKFTKSNVSFNYKIDIREEKFLPYPRVCYVVINVYDPRKKSIKVITNFMVYDDFIESRKSKNSKKITIKLNIDDLPVYQEYKKAIIFVAFVSTEVDLSGMSWTNTVAKEFDISKF